MIVPIGVLYNVQYSVQYSLEFIMKTNLHKVWWVFFQEIIKGRKLFWCVEYSEQYSEQYQWQFIVYDSVQCSVQYSTSKWTV